MTMSSGKIVVGGGIGVRRSLSAVFLSVAVVVLSLVVVSMYVGVSPFQSSIHEYIFRPDDTTKSDLVYSDRNQSKDNAVASEPTRDKGEDEVIKEPTLENQRLKDTSDQSSDGKEAMGFANKSSSINLVDGDSAMADSGSRDESVYSEATLESPPVSSDPSVNSGKDGRGSCDLYHGKWSFDTNGPLYTNNSCPIITQMQNCQGNGRPDKDYENWRWKPNECDLPRFDGWKFLELMKHKTLAFVGDSVARNQMESLLCILWQVETPQNRGNRKMQKWFFRSTSTSIVRIWSSWLVHRSSEAIGPAPEGLDKVHLDIPDETFMEFLPKFDVLVLSSGHWFAKRSAYILNGSIVGGQLWWPKEGGNMQYNNIEAFGVSVETCLSAIANNPDFKGVAIVRSYSPDHYEGGAWNTGGSCTGKVKPVEEVVRNGFTDTMYEKQLTGFRRAVANAKPGARLSFMDITNPFGFRPDGHPGPYRSPDPNKVTKRGPDGKPPPQDCLHWCMPGPIDTWNELLLETIRREFEGAGS